MPGSDFAAWVAEMQSRGWSKRRCAAELGCGPNSINLWIGKGAPLYIAYACAALAYGLKAWRVQTLEK